MATLKEAVYTLLEDDSTLQTLLGYDASSKPRVVFWQMPPKTPAPPMITYFLGAQSGFEPRNLIFNITAWGKNFETVLHRVHALLHKQLSISATDFYFKGCLFDGAGPELFDDGLRVPYLQHRFRVFAWKT